MALATGANVALDNNWTLVSIGVDRVFISLGGTEAIVFAFGATAPVAGTNQGHILQPTAGRDSYSGSGHSADKIWARTLRDGASTSIAVTKG